MSERRRQATVVGVALLGAAGLLALFNSSAGASAPPVPQPKPPPPPPVPVTVPPGTSSGGVPTIPPAAFRPIVKPAPVAAPSRPALVFTAYRLDSSGQTVKLLSTTVVNAAIAICKPYGCAWVLDSTGKQVFRTGCTSAPRPAYVYTPPKVSVYAGQATISKSGRSL